MFFFATNMKQKFKPRNANIRLALLSRLMCLKKAKTTARSVMSPCGCKMAMFSVCEWTFVRVLVMLDA